MRKSAFLYVGILVIVAAKLNAQTAVNYFEQAMRYKQNGNYTETARQMIKALELEPNNQGYRYELAEAHYLSKKFYESIPIYEELIKSDEKNIIVLARLSEMYSMSPQKMKAVEYAEKALKMKPTDGVINKMLARTFFEVKHYPKAIEQYLIAEKALPGDKDIPYKLAFCYRKTSNVPEAMNYFVKSATLDPDNANKWYEAGNSCYDAYYYDKAVSFYQQAEAKGFYKTKTFYSNWALTYVEMKDYDKALAMYNKAKEYAPYDKGLNLSIAEMYMKKGDFEKSRNMLDEVLQINPKDAEVIYMKGMTYYKAGNTPKAEVYFNQAFALDPSLRSLRYTKVNF